MRLIEEMKGLRQSNKVSIKRLAEISGIHRQSIEAWEYRNVSPTVEKLNKVLNALGYELKICKIKPIKKE